jgi:hypothetical protein
MSTHWSEPSAPDEREECRYQAAVLAGQSREEVEAAEEAAHTEIAARIDAQLAASRRIADDWEAVRRAAWVAAAEAVEARDWAAKRQAVAVARQAIDAACVVGAAIFGQRQMPAAYAPLVEAGRRVTKAQAAAAWQVVDADDRAARAQRQRSRNGN